MLFDFDHRAASAGPPAPAANPAQHLGSPVPRPGPGLDGRLLHPGPVAAPGAWRRTSRGPSSTAPACLAAVPKPGWPAVLAEESPCGRLIEYWEDFPSIYCLMACLA